MKKLSIQIHAELEVPDEWELVDHPGGMQVLKIGDQYVDFDLTPLATRSLDPDATWSDEDHDLVNSILDAVTELEAEMTLQSRH